MPIAFRCRSYCLAALAVLLFAPQLIADEWPQWRGPRRDGVWRETGIVDKLPEKLRYLWRTPIGAGYAGPAVAGGRVYVTDRVLGDGESNPDDPFARTAVGGQERVLCLDVATGKEIWKHVYPCRYAVGYPAGPRATPTVDDYRVYTLGTMGDLYCLSTADGKVHWKKNYVEDFGTEINVWGMSSAPLVDGVRLIAVVGGQPNSGVVAFHKRTGEVIWRALDLDDPGYCPPVIFHAGRRRQLIVWTPKEVVSLAPETGAVYWREPFKINHALTVPTPIFDEKTSRLFVTAFYNGPMMFELARSKPTARVLWRGKSDSERRTDGLHAILCTPFFHDDHLYGVCSYGQLRCLEAGTGKRVWETRDATGEGRWWNAFLVQHEDRFFLHNEQGDLIIARLSPQGYEEISRAKLIEATRPVMRRRVVWSHPAFARRSVFARNDHEIVRVDLAAPSK